MKKFIFVFTALLYSLLPPIANLSVNKTGKTGTVNLSWSYPVDIPSNSFFYIQYATTPAGPWDKYKAQISQSTGPVTAGVYVGFKTGLPPDVTYYFAVFYSTPPDDSPPSNTASAYLDPPNYVINPFSSYDRVELTMYDSNKDIDCWMYFSTNTNINFNLYYATVPVSDSMWAVLSKRIRDFPFYIDIFKPFCSDIWLNLDLGGGSTYYFKLVGEYSTLDGPRMFTSLGQAFIPAGSQPAFSNITISPSKITPDNDGSSDFLSIDFEPSDFSKPWKVVISTILPTEPAFKSENVFYEFNGTGRPYGLQWFGRDRIWSVVPSGTYYISFGFPPHLITTRTVVVESDYLMGRVLYGGQPLANSYISVQGGPGYGFYANSITDSNGDFKVYGIKLGYQYNIYVSSYIQGQYTTYNFVIKSTGNIGDLIVPQPVNVRIHVKLDKAVDSSRWGWASVHSADWSKNGWGNLYFAQPTQNFISTGSRAGYFDPGSDPGSWPSTWTVITLPPLPNDTYYIEISGIDGYSGDVPPENPWLNHLVKIYNLTTSTDIVVNLTRNPTISGWVILPTTYYGDVNVDIQVLDSNTNTPRGWGWVYIPGDGSYVSDYHCVYGTAGVRVAISSAVYSLSVKPGSYKIRAVANLSGPEYNGGPWVWKKIGIGESTFTVVANDDVGSVTNGCSFNNKVGVVNGVNIDLTQGYTLNLTLKVVGTAERINELNNTSIWLNLNNPSLHDWTGISALLTKVSQTQAQSSTTIKGLYLGTYELWTWLYGFDVVDTNGQMIPLPVRINISTTANSYTLLLKQWQGRLITKTLTDSNVEDVKIVVQGPSGVFSTSPDAFGISEFNNLGSGKYRVTAYNPSNGKTIDREVYVRNDITSPTNITLDLTGGYVSVEGEVVMFDTITVRGPSGSEILVSSIPGVIDNAGMDFTNNFTTYSYFDGFNYVIPYTFVPKARIELKSVDLTLGDVAQGGSNWNMSMLGKNRYAAIETTIDPKKGKFRFDKVTPGIYDIRLNNYWLGEGELASAVVDETIIVKDDGSIEHLRKMNPDFQIIRSSMGITISSISIPIQKGFSVEGEVVAPPGKNLNNATARARLIKDGFVFREFQGYISGQSTPFKLSGFPRGKFTLELNEVVDSGSQIYRGESKTFEVGSSNITGLRFQLTSTVKIKGKIDVKEIRPDGSVSIFRVRNKEQSLGGNFGVGVFKGDEFVGASQDSRQDGEYQFVVYGIQPNQTYSLEIVGAPPQMFDSYQGGKAENTQNIIRKKISSVEVAESDLDLGVIEVERGVSLTGSVVDDLGVPVVNLPVVAIRSDKKERWEIDSVARTDVNGRFILYGLDPTKLYDITIAPRSTDSRYNIMLQMGIIVEGPETQFVPKEFKAVNPAKVNYISASVSKYAGTLKGSVTTEDGGPIMFAEQHEGRIMRLPVARIFLNKEGETPRNNPLGDIETPTDFEGKFKIPRLEPGKYTLFVLSEGYAMHRQDITIKAGINDIGSIVLKRGGKLIGKLFDTSGRKIKSLDVRVIAAATSDFSDAAIGVIDADPSTYEINLFTIEGFRVNKKYTVFAVDNSDELIPLGEVVFTSTTEVKTQEFITSKIAPDLTVKAVKVRVDDKDAIKIHFKTTESIRAKELEEKATDYWKKVVSIVTGSGVLKVKEQIADGILSDRKNVVVLYELPQGETGFSLMFKATTTEIDRNTGNNYVISREYEFRVGNDIYVTEKVNNLSGGSVEFDEEDDKSSVDFSMASFEFLTTTDPAKQKGFVTLSRTGSSGSSGTSMLKTLSMMPQEAFSRSVSRAIKLAQAANVNPMSGFYEIFLPQGVSSNLKKKATLTLQYSTSAVTDTSTINVYYYDEKNNVFLLENEDRSVDTKNNTISVSIRHASTFVILKDNRSVITGSTGVGDLFVYNFPNPFSLKSKTLTLKDASNQNQTIRGTMFHIGLPPGKQGEVKIEIFTVAGELVRTITENAPTGNTHYYIEWDGRNDSGKDVASGIYIARFTLNGGDEKFVKLAVVK